MPLDSQSEPYFCTPGVADRGAQRTALFKSGEFVQFYRLLIWRRQLIILTSFDIFAEISSWTKVLWWLWKGIPCLQTGQSKCWWYDDLCYTHRTYQKKMHDSGTYNLNNPLHLQMTYFSSTKLISGRPVPVIIISLLFQYCSCKVART